jgi:hypothetical protein
MLSVVLMVSDLKERSQFQVMSDILMEMMLQEVSYTTLLCKARLENKNKVKNVKLSPCQVVEAHRAVCRLGSHIF